MSTTGLCLLAIAFACSVASVACFVLARASRSSDAATRFSRFARVGVLGSAAALLAACLLLVFCFMTGDVSIKYVLEERSLSVDGMAWLYKLSGLWAGRSGSLMFWAFLIALFNSTICLRSRGKTDALDDVAMLVVEIVVGVFVALLLFSTGNMPFEATPAHYFDANGELTALASTYSMNQLLEHWAMAIHPPLLFAGYAGLTVPFAYAVSALALDDLSREWAIRATRYALASWLFLGAGIGLGAVWAYVVLGWGGYWGWDPVENASLLSWLVCVALVHTLTVYRRYGSFKRWAVVCACLAFTFVIVATFITRSGIVQSVHAFTGDAVSVFLFGGLIVVSLLVLVVGLIVRRRSFAGETADVDEVGSLLTRDAAYYFNNVIMVVFAVLLAYMTICPALPKPLPFAGQSLGTSAYEAIARPLGIAYLLILSVCPLLSWGSFDRKKFLKQARVPALCALALFAALAYWWATEFVPTYDATMAASGSAAMTLLEAGPGWYYNGLALVGLFVASLLFFNAAFMFARFIRMPGKRAAAIGGGFAHISMAVILVGLIGSSMYVYEQAGYIGREGGQALQVREYTLTFAEDSIADNSETAGTVLYEASFDVSKNGVPVGRISPSVQLDVNTQQNKLNAAVLGFPEEDLFVVYKGVNQNGDYSVDVRINPFITLVWVGFGMLMLGTAFALLGRRGPKRAGAGERGTSVDAPARAGKREDAGE